MLAADRGTILLAQSVERLEKRALQGASLAIRLSLVLHRIACAATPRSFTVTNTWSYAFVDRSRKVRMELSCQGVGFVQLELCGFFLRIPAHFGLYVEVVLLDTKLEVIPLFAATVIFCILHIKAGKQLRFAGIMPKLCNGFL